MKKLYCWNITKDTYITILLGFVMLGVSVAMLPFSSNGVLDTVMSFILRDALMIFGLGVVSVTLYCRNKGKESWEELGITTKKLRLSLILNAIFAVSLLLMFMHGGIPDSILSIKNLYGLTYILVSGIFEMLFIYGFLRMGFEKSFGILPAILLTAVFYSFHHAGFQPEFVKLFFVGIMYVSVYYITKNLFIVFPFFWGVGALWDVLVDSSAGNSIKNSTSFFIAMSILAAIIIWMIILKRMEKKSKLCYQKHQ